jgi:hypothetical protein
LCVFSRKSRNDSIPKYYLLPLCKRNRLFEILIGATDGTPLCPISYELILDHFQDVSTEGFDPQQVQIVKMCRILLYLGETNRKSNAKPPVQEQVRQIGTVREPESGFLPV